MKIIIYQVNISKDVDKVAFRGYYEVIEKIGVIPPEIYDEVFRGEVDCETLEDVFVKFNWDVPCGYRGRSMSVSDIVVVEADSGEVSHGDYYCDESGFTKIY